MYSIKITNEPHNFTVWTVTVFNQKFLFKKKIESKWFISKESAEQYYEQQQYKYNLK